jgi:hypothetical protein
MGDQTSCKNISNIYGWYPSVLLPAKSVKKNTAQAGGLHVFFILQVDADTRIADRNYL